MSRRGDAGPAANVAKVVTLESTQRQVAVYNPSDPNEVREGPAHLSLTRAESALLDASPQPRPARPVSTHPRSRAASKTPIQTPTRRVRRVTR